MSDTPTREEIAAQLQTIEVRTDPKLVVLTGEIRVGFAGIKGEVKTLRSKLDAVERSASGIKATVVITGIAAVGVLIAVLTYGQSWVGIGVTTRDVVKATVTEVLQQQGAPRLPK